MNFPSALMSSSCLSLTSTFVVMLRIICSCQQFLGEQASNSWSQEGITQFAPHRGADFEARASDSTP